MVDAKILARRALALLDLTDLTDTCTPSAIEALCARAITPHGQVAAVCIYPAFVKQAKALLAGSGVKVATVINFPHGGRDIKAVMAEAKAVLADGVDEIDLVLAYKAFMNGHISSVAEMVSPIAALMPKHTVLKVILETGALKYPALIEWASALAIESGAQFIKTSTGKIDVSATPDAARIMLNTIKASRMPVGFKAAGGIKTLDDAATYLALADEILGPDWAQPATFRFGASGLLDVLLAALDGKTSELQAGY